MNNILVFTDRAAFREWLEGNGADADGVWLLFAKTDDVVTLTAAEALEEALCFGWIDGQIQSLDNKTYKKYFARRRTTSKWSAKNRALIGKLIERGLVTQQGFAAIENAKKNGTWDSPAPAAIDQSHIDILLNALQSCETAYRNFVAMPPSVKKSYTALYLDAKGENTRQRRLEKIIDRLNKNLKPM